MSGTRMPYQRLKKCGKILVAARGSSIDAFSLDDGSLLSTWTCPPSQVASKSTSSPQAVPPKETSESSPVDVITSASTPQSKRRKLSPDSQSGQNGKPSPTKKSLDVRYDAVATGLGAPAVIALATTRRGEHVIAVTGEDKSIRVFENITEDGKHELRQASIRPMPKRPCSIVITPDDATIIIADKFGDVYSLPLLASDPQVALGSEARDPEISSVPRPFVPAANEFTIHSQRNRRALENQRRHTNRSSEKSDTTTNNTALLGHVSMLTDILLGHGDGRTYILTADRDEHIRVSRGIPQTHIIEGFCLGHSEIITRMCIPEDRGSVLISGGGDDDLFVWKWQTGQLISKTDLRSHVVDVMRSLQDQDTISPLRITVSGLHHVRGGPIDFVFVTCEAVPAVFAFILEPEMILKHSHTLRIPGNALDIVASVAYYPHQESPLIEVIVSVDTIHKSGSSSELCDLDGSDRLLVFDIEPSCKTLALTKLEFSQGNDLGIKLDKECAGNLSNLFYNLKSMRKRDEDDRED